MTHQCEGLVTLYGGRNSRLCRNKGKYSAQDSHGYIRYYCKYHYEPIADKKRAERQKEQDIAYKARLQEQKLTQAKIDAYPDFVQALIEISEYENLTPGRLHPDVHMQRLAKAVLKKHKVKL